MFRDIESIRRIHLDWVISILSSNNWTSHRLATKAGLSPSALTKFLNDTTGTRTLNSYSVEKLGGASGMPLHGNVRRPQQHDDHSASELEPLRDTSEFFEQSTVLLEGLDARILKTQALELAGYMPGDTLLIDKKVSPVIGDVVVAQVHENGRVVGKIVRIYQISFLMSATMDPALLMPILISKEIVLEGVVVAMIRSRRGAGSTTA